MGGNKRPPVARSNKRRSKRFFGLLGALVVLALVGARVVAAAPFDENRPRVGQQAPAFEAQGFSPAQLRGKKSLVMVFYRGHF